MKYLYSIFLLLLVLFFLWLGIIEKEALRIYCFSVSIFIFLCIPLFLYVCIKEEQKGMNLFQDLCNRMHQDIEDKVPYEYSASKAINDLTKKNIF